jgi:hypothetical protein
MACSRSGTNEHSDGLRSGLDGDSGQHDCRIETWSDQLLLRPAKLKTLTARTKEDGSSSSELVGNIGGEGQTGDTSYRLTGVEDPKKRSGRSVKVDLPVLHGLETVHHGTRFSVQEKISQPACDRADTFQKHEHGDRKVKQVRT